jgi:hypothetical protein
VDNHEDAEIQADFASSFMKDAFCAIHVYKLQQKTGRHKKANAILETNDGRTKELFRQKIRLSREACAQHAASTLESRAKDSAEDRRPGGRS